MTFRDRVSIGKVQEVPTTNHRSGDSHFAGIANSKKGFWKDRSRTVGTERFDGLRHAVLVSVSCFFARRWSPVLS